MYPHLIISCRSFREDPYALAHVAGWEIYDPQDLFIGALYTDPAEAVIVTDTGSTVDYLDDLYDLYDLHDCDLPEVCVASTCFRSGAPNVLIPSLPS